MSVSLVLLQRVTQDSLRRMVISSNKRRKTAYELFFVLGNLPLRGAEMKCFPQQLHRHTHRLLVRDLKEFGNEGSEVLE